MKITKSVTVPLFFIFTLAALCFASARLTIAQTNTTTRSVTTWEEKNDGHRILLRIEGKVEFNESYTDVASVSEDSLLRVEEERGGTTRRFEVSRGANGELRRTYWFNGSARAFDAEAQGWLSRLVLQGVRQNGFDAEKRVQRILRERGVSGVLEEIRLIKSDYGQRLYFRTLIRDGNLAGSALGNVLREAALQISSDYEKAQLLIGMADNLQPPAVNAFFDATRSVRSDYERRRVLSSLLKKGTRGHEVLMQLLQAAATISSDYEKATFLLEASSLYMNDARLRSAFLATVETIKSDYERGRVLTGLLKKKQISSNHPSANLSQAS